MFERFTERARKVIVLAEQEARQLGCSEVGSDHLLLGLLAEDEGLAARVLEALGIRYEQVRERAARTLEPETAKPQISAAAKKTLELSLREALSLGHNYVGTEHILLGLLREDGDGLRVLEACDTSVEEIRNEIIRALSAPGRRQQVTAPEPSAQQRASEAPRRRPPLVVLTRRADDAQLPVMAYEGDGAADLVAAEETLIGPQQRALVGTGLRLAIPAGYAGLVMPRSGLAAKHGITVLNTPGLIDAGYRGEVKVILYNTSNSDFHVQVGDRIAQLMIVPLVATSYLSVDTLPESERGDGGFGSSGIRS